MAHEYIGLEGFCSKVGGVKERRGDECICLCPAHSDHKPSLYVKESERGLLITCRAHCTLDEICAAAGVSKSTLFREPPKGRGKGQPREAQKAPRPEARKADTLYYSYEAAYGKIGKVEKVYPYTDARGNLRFEAVRIRLPDGDKTFRQHRPADPARGRFPFIKNVPRELSAGILYRMPEVAAAVAEDRTIYVVEGEKDCDTLIDGMGLMGATCAMGAEKWTPTHSEALRGADVVIVPDHDDPGEKHGQKVMESLLGIAKRVRLVHLTDGYPQLPAHGDISDLAGLIGTDRAREMLLQLAEQAAEANQDLYLQACGAIGKFEGYCVSNGCICQRVQDGGLKVLSTFVALPVQEVTRDDGLERMKQLQIVGWNAAGDRLATLLVKMEKFGTMGWAPENWGLQANIMPGTTVKDKLRALLTFAGAQVATQHTIYSHTGWRRIQGKWAYLYNGGCIGAENVEVQMEGKLASYTMGETPEGLDPFDAMISSLGLLETARRGISVPLMGYMYLSPLREFLLQAGQAPSFLLMLKGGTSTHKSTLAALFCSHFGRFTYDALTCSFHDTANAIRRQAFTLKDAPLIVDDYHPTSSLQDRRKMQGIAQELSRTFGDGASRNRMSADLKLQQSMPARCLALLTGEELPDIGESGVNRFYVVEVHDGDIEYTKGFTDYQRRARIGELRAAMRGYIEWLIPQADSLAATLRERFLAFQQEARTKLVEPGKKVHDRAAPAVAHIMVGLDMMLRYMAHLGFIEEDEIETELAEYWGYVIENSRTQAEKSAEERPLKMYMNAVTEMLAARTVTVIDITAGSAEISRADRNVAGYMDAQNYYFLAGTLWGAVNRFYGDQGRVIAANQAEIHRMLVEEGIVEQIGSDGKTTKNKRINGKNMRLLWIPRWRLEGGKRPDQPTEQMKLVEVEDPENPFQKGG